jgi:hypothetical protein
MRKRAISIGVVLTLILALCACSMFSSTTKLTPKQNATIWFQVYNSTYDDTMAVASNPLSTPAQKDMAAKKKVILTQAWPLLRAYAAIVDAGGTPTADEEAQITALINQLAALATTAVTK